MIKFESNAHWYACQGKVAKAQHDADLRVARKKLLYPSVTTIDKDVFKNDFLDRWKMNELVNAAAGSFKQPHEDDSAYANRIYDLSLEKSKVASEFGKKLHDSIEHYPEYGPDASLHPWLDRFGEWYNDCVERPLHREEILFDHDIGVAGRCDFIGLGKGPYAGSLIIPDWKTQNVKTDKDTGKKKPASFYDSWPRQLAVYAVAYAKREGIELTELPTCISVVIDSNEPNYPSVKVWTRDEIREAYRTFVVGAWLWFSKRNYWPQPRGRFDPTFNLGLPL